MGRDGTPRSRYRLSRWMYRGGRPNWLARGLNRIGGSRFGFGRLVPAGWVQLRVRGRRSGRLISFPMVVVDHQGDRYLVAMLGPNTNWVRNLRAADGHAVLRHRQSVAVRLDEVDRSERAPILRKYLAVAPGARPHLPVDRRAPLEEFEAIADSYPVFRITVLDEPAQ